MAERRTSQPPKTEKHFVSIWHELIYICRKIHYWLYVGDDETHAKRYLPRLKRTLRKLPEKDVAIAAAEGFALFHMLNGEVQLSLKYRRREIRGLERLKSSIQRSVQAGRMSGKQARQILAGHGAARIRERRAIVRNLTDAARVKLRGKH